MLHRLAIDAGGTSTRAMVLTSDGTCLGVGRGGRGNPVSEGSEKAADAIASATEAALRRSGTSGADIGAVTLAMAGGLTFTPSAWLTAPLQALEVGAAVTVEPDLLAMFCSGSSRPAGYGLVAGTGATAVRVEDGRMAALADGLGWLLGDDGSGYWIGHRVARAVAAELDGRGPATTLTPRLLDQLGITPTPMRIEGRPAALTALVQAVYSASPLQLATFAPLALGDPDDDVASAILDEAVASLARAVLDVRDRDLTGPLVVGGGIAAQPRMHDALLVALAEHGLDGPSVVVPDGLVGAGVLALRRAGVVVDEHVFARLQDTTASARR